MGLEPVKGNKMVRERKEIEEDRETETESNKYEDATIGDLEERSETEDENELR